MNDLLDGADLADPRVHAERDLGAVWRRLRDEDPVHRHGPAGEADGFWVVTRYDDVAAVYKDSETFTSERGNVLDTLLNGGDSAAGRMLAVTDGPRHGALRGALKRPFAPRALQTVVESVRRGTWTQISRALDRPGCDFANDVAAYIPLAAICDLLGVPESDRGLIISLTSTALSSADGEATAEGTWTSRNDLLLYFAELAESRRAKPYDDLVSLLVTQQVDGRPLSHEEIIFNCYSIVMGGHETTRLSMVGAVRAFIDHPAQWAAFERGDVTVESAVEEVLRWTTPALHAGRTATRDTFLGGSFVEEGDIVTIWNVSANRDERVFDRPDEFDLARTPNKHLSFAYGAHFCLGAYLARAEIGALLTALREQVRTIEPAGEPRRVYSSFLSGYSALPVRLIAR
ncbi:cytochrome P450 [Actinoplanes philippinensis]|uniref:cytochrome P450 n=1 Tax=Actinoplanes philippinensis TaxID=35752 RepID=UPI0033DBEF64